MYIWLFQVMMLTKDGKCSFDFESKDYCLMLTNPEITLGDFLLNLGRAKDANPYLGTGVLLTEAHRYAEQLVRKMGPHSRVSFSSTWRLPAENDGFHLMTLKRLNPLNLI